MTKEEKAIRDFCGHHADWWPSITQVQEMLALAQPEVGLTKKWVGLTEVERNDVVWSNTRADDLKEAYDVAVAIEQALRNKNTKEQE
jgi:hypothetical protein